jgi:lipopolysaccharide export system permease protein
VGPFTFALSALTCLLLINYIAKRFGELVGKGLPTGVIAEFFLLSVPFTIAMTLPMSVLVATLYAFSRLAAENEITAMKSTGISMVRLLVPVVITASLFSVVMVAFNDGVLPRANHRLRTLQGDIARKKPTFALKEQIINEVSPGRFYLKTNHLDQFTGQMREVTIYDLSDPLRRRTIYADSGEMAFAPNGNDLLLTLRRGHMLEVPKEEPSQLQRLRFDLDHIRVANVANQLALTTDDAYKSDREMSICELQNEVARRERELDQARADLRAALDLGTREALTGTPAAPVASASASPSLPVGTPAPRSRHVTLGRVYCDATHRLRANLVRAALVRTAEAAEPAVGGGVAQRPPAQDTGRAPRDTAKARGDSAARADSAALARLHAMRAAVFRADSASKASVTLPPAVVADETGEARVTPFLLPTQIESARAAMTDSRHQMNQYAVELHKKIAISVACVVFVLVGAPIALRFPRGGVGLVIGVSLVVFAIYYVGLIAGEALADRDILSPFWGMWSANILLTVTGVALLVRMGRESATARGGDLGELLEILRSLARTITFRGRSRAEPEGEVEAA